MTNVMVSLQDPLDPGRCVMVIRSLVPGGSAERHGGLLPGDQLVSVNQTQVDPLTLDEAVDVLKSVPSGTVRLGICKPLVVRAHLSVPVVTQFPPSCVESDLKSVCVGGGSREEQRGDSATGPKGSTHSVVLSHFTG